MITQAAQDLAEEHLDKLEASLPQHLRVTIILRDLYDPDRGHIVTNDQESIIEVPDPANHRPVLKQKKGLC